MQAPEGNLAKEHDLKLELDVRGQESITESLLRAYPNTRVLGEERIDRDYERGRRPDCRSNRRNGELLLRRSPFLCFDRVPPSRADRANWLEA
jgi:hypothetical protein